MSILVLLLLATACQCSSTTVKPETPVPTQTSPLPPADSPAPPAAFTPSPPTPKPEAPVTASPDYTFGERNMFFGLSLIKPQRDASYVAELGASWLSLQPHVVWFAIERQPGIYDWSALDSEIKGLQGLGLDVTMVLSPLANVFGEKRQQVAALMEQYPSLTAFFREGKVAELALYPHDDTLPLWINFVRAAVERYDGDSKSDMPGLRYAIRNWHFVEEYPIPEIRDAQTYIDLLKITYQTIKSEDPQAKVILVGLAGNYLRYFAFMDGLIADDDAGVIDGEKHPRAWWRLHPFWKNAKAEYESILETAGDYFDIIDIHAYIIKETFMEGEIDYINQAMKRCGYSRPVWIIEGGGPFKNYPGKKAENTPADPYFGLGSEKENAEFVVKLLAMSAARGVERQHWGLGLENTDDGYWDGPWKGMGLIDPDEGYKKPSYYSFKMIREKLDGFTQVHDLTQGDIRLFSFAVGTKEVFVAWNSGSGAGADLSDIFGSTRLRLTPVVTELDASRQPVYPVEMNVDAKTVPLGITPVFLELIK